MTQAFSIAAAELQRLLTESSEIALLDIREPGIFGEGHLLLSSNLPYSRLESEITRRVPRRGTRIVLVGEQENAAAASRRLAQLGYNNVSLLQGGTDGWVKAGFPLFPSIHVPSKAFAEFVEHTFHTPAVSARDLEAWRAGPKPPVILDGRTAEEFARYHVPGARHCANADLVLRFADFVQDPTVPVVVSCAGRTRGIMGAQSLISAGVPNPVYSLAGGTQGWKLAGLAVVNGAGEPAPAFSAAGIATGRQRARALADKAGIERINLALLEDWKRDPQRTTYVIDVRSPAEFSKARLPGTINVPGGQLVQTLDRWAVVRGARIVLVDDLAARADVTAYWLQQLGWLVVVLDDPELPEALRKDARADLPEPLASAPETLAPADAAPLLAANALVLDVRTSADYAQYRVRGAVWTNRSRLKAITPALDTASTVLIFGTNDDANRLAAIDLRESHPSLSIHSVAGGLAEWREAGLAVDDRKIDIPPALRIDHLFWLHQRHTGSEEHSRAYLAWEESLVGALGQPAAAGFRMQHTA
ncbi:hypothetical protein CAL29_01500 [Bordetella genomosp. 10]|uniref:Rhodanese domain-containing protein n=1 Tax=Bordetella genomosp. 10 TaxID=1416804 RepID=A0A261SLD3_9BORD|nr:rhodanese-like domain-containing protein [Bordetella genomosp. 10]OZI37133.1 hypothetical protein CAL29_01500 [Bordetella genomosp. 10]